MPTADNSYRVKINNLKSRTLAVFHQENPNVREFQGSQFLESEYLSRKVGQQAIVIQPPQNPRIVEAPCGCCQDIGSNLNVASPGFDYIDPNWEVYITWNLVPNATSYVVTAQDDVGPLGGTIIYTSETSATLSFPSWTGTITATVTASNSCSSSTGTATSNPCFLEGAMIQMADGIKPIESVEVGDLVVGAFGELNPVLALHRPLLGNAKMSLINEEHSSTSHHPHISIDKKFYCQHPSVVEETTYGKEHDVIDGSGAIVKRLLHGLNKGRVQELKLGIELKTVEGSRVVETLETYELPPETQLYNLVVGGSHTYHVDGYAVTGWPREDDFDYDTWTPRT